MKLDYRQVEKSLDKLLKSTDKIAVKGVRAAAFKLVEDSKMKKPRAPHLHGHLWTQHIIDAPQFKINLISVRVGSSTPYAARLHQGEESWNWTLAGSGPKWIITKIMAYGKDYLKIQYEVIKKGISAI